jgi:hypothetical protein
MPARFLIDVNLPRDFAFWNGPDFIHQSDLGRFEPTEKSGGMPGPKALLW